MPAKNPVFYNSNIISNQYESSSNSLQNFIMPFGFDRTLLNPSDMGQENSYIRYDAWLHIEMIGSLPIDGFEKTFRYLGSKVLRFTNSMIDCLLSNPMLMMFFLIPVVIFIIGIIITLLMATAHALATLSLLGVAFFTRAIVTLCSPTVKAEKTKYYADKDTCGITLYQSSSSNNGLVMARKDICSSSDESGSAADDVLSQLSSSSSSSFSSLNGCGL